jgi:hypothetical protein
MEWLVVLLIGLVFSFAIARWAEAWGRTSWVYFLLSLLLTPLVGALALLVAGRRVPRPQSSGRASPRIKYCTKCGSPLPVEVSMCPYCHKQASQTQVRQT